MCCSRSWITLGAVMGGMAVAMGAFAAHGLDDYFSEKYRGEVPKRIAGLEVPVSYRYLEDVKTGATYQMYHALALIAVGLLGKVRPSRSLQLAGWSFLLGIVLFSGSLYALTITGQRWWGILTPIGGTLFIAGWVAMAIAASPCGEPSDAGSDN